MLTAYFEKIVDYTCCLSIFFQNILEWIAALETCM